MVPAGNKAKRLSSVSHTTVTNHHHHHHQEELGRHNYPQVEETMNCIRQNSSRNLRSCQGAVSHAHRVNKELAAGISRQLGLEWTPGQTYCCIHTVVGFQEGMTKIWLRYQEKIGYKKMCPSINGFVLDMEDKSLKKQILE